MRSAPYGIKLLGGGIEDGDFVSEDSRLEVSLVRSLGTYSGSSEIGRADIGFPVVEDHHLEVYSRAENPVEVLEENRIPVKLFSEDWARFLCVDKPDLNTALQQLCQHLDNQDDSPVTGIRKYSEIGNGSAAKTETRIQ